MNRRIYILLFFMVLSHVTFSSAGSYFENKFLKGELILEDGTIKKGYIQVPKRDLAMSIAFKESPEAQAEDIKTKTVRSFTVYSDSGEPYVFESVYLDLDNDPKKQKITQYKSTMLVVENGYATLYIKGNNFKTNRDGTIEIVAYSIQSEGGTPKFYYYLRKKGETHAVFFDITYTHTGSIIINSGNSLVKGMENYLPEYPELIARVKNKEFNHKKIPEIIELYNTYMRGRK